MRDGSNSPNWDVGFRSCAAHKIAPVPARHMNGKFLDPESGVRIRFVSDVDPFPSGTQASLKLDLLRRRGVRAFFANGGTMRLLGQYLRNGLCVRVEA